MTLSFHQISKIITRLFMFQPVSESIIYQFYDLYKTAK